MGRGSSNLAPHMQASIFNTLQNNLRTVDFSKVLLGVQMTVVRTIRTVIALVALAALIPAPKLVGADLGALSSSIAGAPLSADQVVDNLVRKSRRRHPSTQIVRLLEA